MATENPYLTFAEEPPSWKDCSNGVSWEDHKKAVENNNGLWWKKHTEDGSYAHRTQTPLNVQGDDFPLGSGNRYGPFIYCPLPVSGYTQWGFQRKEGLDQFLADVEAGKLPTGGKAAPPPRSTAKAAPKPAVAAPAADLDLSADDPFAALDLAVEEPAPTPEEDPFAALDLTTDEPELTFAAQMEGDDEPALVGPGGHDPADDEDAAAFLAEAEAAGAAEEPEVDEWGEVIVKPGKTDSTAQPETAAEDDDPFAMLG
jgi:hypothetical protein